MGNKQTFDFRSVSSQSFDFILDSFDYAVTFFFRIKQKVRISFISSALSKSISNFTLRKIKVSFVIRTIGRILLSLTMKTPRFGIVFREIGRILLPITVKKIKFTITSKAAQKLISSISIKKIKISFIALYGTFYTLLLYDPQSLGTLDTKTLEEMDFTVIP